MASKRLKPLHVCLLTNQDLDDPQVLKDDWPCDPRPFLPEATWHLTVLEDKPSAAGIVRERIEGGVHGDGTKPFDVFFNLCDGAADQPDAPGIEVILELEAAGVPYTGASSECYEPTRARMKSVCKSIGVATPASVTVQSEDDMPKVLAKLDFPMFVKHHNSYASVDISRHSKVVSEAGLRRQVRKITAKHGAALVEAYIDGPECTVLAVENPDDPESPILYTPVQYEFPEGEHFKHSDMKWVNYGGMQTCPVDDPDLAARLRDEVGRFFTAIGCAGYGRCDVRIGPDGTPYILEINTNCGVYHQPADYGSADFCLTLDPEGHEGFTRTLVKAALARVKRGWTPSRRERQVFKYARAVQ
ncbi:MAG: hypothetical protein MK101_11750 [Phycisphaerales bacterium]|nr:hypothetical protein [Phycisphaerales bacterium]